MSRRSTISGTGVATSAWMPLDTYSPTLSLAAVVSGGAATFTIEYTLDDILSGVAGTAFAITGMSAITATTAATWGFPIAGVRINQTVGAGTVTLTVLQAGGTVA